jgi:hypothetical protein
MSNRSSKRRASLAELRAEAERAKAAVRDGSGHPPRAEVDAGNEPDRANAGGPGAFAGGLLRLVVRHPAATAGVAFAALSLIGPGRTLRLVSRAAGLASLASGIASSMGTPGAKKRRPVAPKTSVPPGNGRIGGMWGGKVGGERVGGR